MHINKIVHRYFAFVVGVMAVAGGSGIFGYGGSSDVVDVAGNVAGAGFGHSGENIASAGYASVLGIAGSDVAADGDVAAGVAGEDVAAAIVIGDEDDFDSDDVDIFTFEFANDPVNAYALPGQMDKEVMKIVVVSEGGGSCDGDDGSCDFSLDFLRFKLEGVASLAVRDVRLYDGDVVVAEGKRDNEYFVFSDIDYCFEAGKKVELSLRVDLNEGVTSGTRLRFNIENKDNIGLYVDGEPYYFDDDFSLRGKYLTIVNRRTWMRVVQF